MCSSGSRHGQQHKKFKALVIAGKRTDEGGVFSAIEIEPVCLPIWAIYRRGATAAKLKWKPDYEGKEVKRESTG